MAGLVWNLQGLGRGWAALGSITERTNQAFEELILAQQALAARDFTSSAEHFSVAGNELAEARAELHTALATTRTVLAQLDLTGTVRSGDQLLAAGESLTQAGEHLSQGFNPLLNVTVLPAKKEANDKLNLVDALEITRQEMKKTEAELVKADNALQSVRVSVAPENAREQILSLQRTVPRVRELVASFNQRSDLLLNLLGSTRERQYLLLFQNNHELRPTGGFIGSIAVANVDRGVVEEVDVQTVYDPDGQLKEFIAPPPPLEHITDRWFLRDANWFVNYPTSAQKVAQLFEKEGGPTVDGVIAITPVVIQQLLQLTGPIEVPAYDLTIDSENFVPLTQDLVTYSYDREINEPKQFLADLTPLLLNKVFAVEENDPLAVLQVLSRMIEEKHILIYLQDEEDQQHIADLKWDGSLPQEAVGFLNVNNANIGGHKSDQFISQEIDYRTEVKANGEAEVVVTIRRTHHGPTEKLDFDYPPDDNPSLKDNIVFQRVLVPLGSELLEAQGFSNEAKIPRIRLESLVALEPDVDVALWQGAQVEHESGTVVGQEAGYTYFANWQVTKPGATSVALYRYRLSQPVKLPQVTDPATRHSAYLAKQPGDTRTEVRAEIVLPAGYRIVHTVPHDGITQKTVNSLVYRGGLSRDLLIGAVVAKE